MSYDPNIIEQMHGEPWTIPDHETEFDMVWYGPEDEDGDVASELIIDDDEFIFSEYQHVEGYFDEYDPNFPFLKTSVLVDVNDLKDALRRLNIPIPKDERLLALYAADYGQAKHAYYGGDDEMVESLP